MFEYECFLLFRQLLDNFFFSISIPINLNCFLYSDYVKKIYALQLQAWNCDPISFSSTKQCTRISNCPKSYFIIAISFAISYFFIYKVLLITDCFYFHCCIKHYEICNSWSFPIRRTSTILSMCLCTFIKQTRSVTSKQITKHTLQLYMLFPHFLNFKYLSQYFI